MGSGFTPSIHHHQRETAMPTARTGADRKSGRASPHQGQRRHQAAGSRPPRGREDVRRLRKGHGRLEEDPALRTDLPGPQGPHQIEEEYFYPAAREALNASDEDIVDEAIVEHAAAKQLIGEIEAMDVGDELYDAKVKVLSR